MVMVLDKQIHNGEIYSVSTEGQEVAQDACTTGIAPATFRVETTRFGTLEVASDLVLTFPEGLIGFEMFTRYTVVCTDDQGVLRWLQSLDEPALAFPIIQPGIFRPDYTPTISDQDARFLGLTPEIPALVFAVVTVPPGRPREMTANLLGPLVINPLTRVGKQVIVQDERYNTKHHIMEEILKNLTGSERPVGAVPSPTKSRKRSQRIA